MGLFTSIDRIKLPSPTSTYRAINLHLVPPPPPHGESNSLVLFGPAETGPGFPVTDPKPSIPTRCSSFGSPLFPPSFSVFFRRGEFSFFSSFFGPRFPLSPLPFFVSFRQGGSLFSRRAPDAGLLSIPFCAPCRSPFSSGRGRFFSLFRSPAPQKVRTPPYQRPDLLVMRETA
jgi:hypothetical protein